MCGIFGFRGVRDSKLLRSMGDTIIHRGPDSDGYFTHDNFSMGMRRLSIIDLNNGEQPIYNEDKSVVVCYNGEIYNYLELRSQLIQRGHIFRTHTDTEVIVHAYEEWGYQCLEYFNGMFAFALYDISQRKLFIARDRCGQKPLYYFYQNGVFIFSSEIKAILKSDCVGVEPNIATIDAYLTLRYVPEPTTLFKNIKILPAAHFLTIDYQNTIDIRRYWDIKLSEKNQYLSKKESFEQLENQLRQSVRLVMRSDVPIGAYLSGGIDSSLLTALMVEHHQSINTYSIGFNSSLDETKEAKETARLLGTHHHEIHCTAEDIGLLPKIVYHMDRPVGDALIIAFYKLAQSAHQDVKVVVSGEGADEIFGGYQFHKILQLFYFYQKLIPRFLHQNAIVPLLNAIPANILNAFFSFPVALGNEGKRHLVRFLKDFPVQSLFGNYIALKTLWNFDAKQALYSEAYKHQLSNSWQPLVRDESGYFLDRLLKLQWDEWLQDWAIIRQDKNTMAHSLEVRLPFLDHHLIELAFRIHPKFKVRWFKDKIIERALAKHLLPKIVVNRPKKPFYFPVNHFFESSQFGELIKLTLNKNQILKRGYFNPDYVQQLLNKMQTREFLYLKQVVSLVILELWHMVFIDKQMIY